MMWTEDQIFQLKSPKWLFKYKLNEIPHMLNFFFFKLIAKRYHFIETEIYLKNSISENLLEKSHLNTEEPG